VSHSGFSHFLLEVKLSAQNSGKMWGNLKDFEGMSDYETQIIIGVNVHLSWK